MLTSMMWTLQPPLTSGSLEAKQLIQTVVWSTVQLVAITGLVDVMAARDRQGLFSGPMFVVRLNVLVKSVLGLEPRAGIEPAAFALPRRRCPVPLRIYQAEPPRR